MMMFQRVADTFQCDCRSSKQSPETMADLFDLVNSFIEKGNGVVDGDLKGNNDDHDSDEIDGDDSDVLEKKELLKRLFGLENGGEDDEVRRNVSVKVEKARRRITGESTSSPGFKRRLMALLRDQGLDAGLCESKCEKNSPLPWSNYEYLDVNVGETRYIINVFLVNEFDIARPTTNYTSLLEVFPPVSVCKVQELNQIVRVMCKAIQNSMNHMKMFVPPWRQYRYVHAKWFGSYKRIVNEFSAKSVVDSNVSDKKADAFLSFPANRTTFCNRPQDFDRRNFGVKVGNLVVAMNGAS